MSKIQKILLILLHHFPKLSSSILIEQTNIETFGLEQMDLRQPAASNLFITNPGQYKYEKTYDGLGTWQSGIIGADYAQLQSESKYFYCGVTAEQAVVNTDDNAGIYHLSFKICHRDIVTCGSAGLIAVSCDLCGDAAIDCNSIDCQWLEGICVDPKREVIPVNSPEQVVPSPSIFNGLNSVLQQTFCEDTRINYKTLSDIGYSWGSCLPKCLLEPDCVEINVNGNNCYLLNQINCVYPPTSAAPQLLNIYRIQKNFDAMDLTDYELVGGYRVKSNIQYKISGTANLITQYLLQTKELCAFDCFQDITCNHFEFQVIIFVGPRCTLFSKFLDESAITTQIAGSTSYDLLRLNHFWQQVPSYRCPDSFFISFDNTVIHTGQSCSKLCELDDQCEVFTLTNILGGWPSFQIQTKCSLYRNCGNPANLLSQILTRSYFKKRSNNLFKIGGHTWLQAYNNAISKGARLLTLEEARLELARNIGRTSWIAAEFQSSGIKYLGALVPLQDAWVAVGKPTNKDWVYIGPFKPISNYYPGMSHLLDVGIYPTCGDGPCTGGFQQFSQQYSLIHSDRFQPTKNINKIARYSQTQQVTFDCPLGQFISNIQFGSNLYMGGTMQIDFTGISEITLINCSDPKTLLSSSRSNLLVAGGIVQQTLPFNLRNYYLCMSAQQQGKVTYNNVIDYKGLDYIKLAYCQYCTSGVIVASFQAQFYTPASPKIFILDLPNTSIKSFEFTPVVLQDPDGCFPSMFCQMFKTDCITIPGALVLPYQLSYKSTMLTGQYDSDGKFTFYFPINTAYVMNYCQRCYSNHLIYVDSQVQIEVVDCSCPNLQDLGIVLVNGGTQIIQNDYIMKNGVILQVTFEPYTVTNLKCFNAEPSYSIVDEDNTGFITYPSPQCIRQDYWEQRLFSNKNFLYDLTGATPDLIQNPVTIDFTSTINPLPVQFLTYFRAEYRGIFKVETTGAYIFYTSSEDGSRITIDGKEVVNMWSAGNILRVSSNTVSLDAGWHSAFVEYFQATGLYGLNIQYEGPGVTKQLMQAIKHIPCLQLDLDISIEKNITSKIQVSTIPISTPIFKSPFFLLSIVQCDEGNVVVNQTKNNGLYGYYLNSGQGIEEIDLLEYYAFKTNVFCQYVNYTISLVEDSIPASLLAIKKDTFEIKTSAPFTQTIVIIFSANGTRLEEYGEKDIVQNQTLQMKLKVYPDFNLPTLDLEFLKDEIKEYIISISEIYTWFGYSEDIPSNDDHFEEFEIYLESKMLLPFSSASIFFNEQGDLNFVINKNENTILYLRIKTIYGIYLYREVKLKVCGFETVSAQKVDFNFKYDDQTKITILSKDYEKLFASSSFYCSLKFSLTDSKMNLLENQIGDIDESSKKITIKGSGLLEYEDFKVFIVATSEGGSSNKSPILMTKWKITDDPLPIFEVEVPVVKEEVKVEEEKKEAKEEVQIKFGFSFEPVLAKITRVGVDGEIEILFDSLMWDESKGLNITHVDEKVLDVYTSNENLEMTWTASSLNLNKLMIKLNFTNPMLVSNSNDLEDNERDMVYINFTDRFMIKSNKGHPVTQDVMSAQLLKQLSNDSVSKKLSAVSQGVMSQMTDSSPAGFMCNLWIAVLFSQVLGSFSSLSIIIFQSMLQLQYPGNVSFLTKMINFVLKVDFLDIDYIGVTLTGTSIADWVDEQQNSEESNEFKGLLIPNIVEQGFESYNPFFNLGGILTLILIFMSQFVFLAIYLLLFQILNCCGYKEFKEEMKIKKLAILEDNQNEGGDDLIVIEKENFKSRCQKWSQLKIKQQIKQWKRNLFFNQFLTVTSESSLQLIMSGILFAYQKQNAKKDENTNKEFNNFNNFISMVGYMCLIFPSILFCTSIMIMIVKEPWLLNKKRFKSIGVLYEQLRTNSILALSYNLNFLLRRVFLTLIFLFMQEFQANQIQMIQYMNLICLMHVGLIKPFQLPRTNVIELANEYIICQIGIILVVFTQFVDDKKKQYISGWFQIFFMLILVVFNVGVIFVDFFDNLRQYFIKYYRLSKYYTIDKPQIIRYQQDFQVKLEQYEIDQLNILKMEQIKDQLDKEGFVRIQDTVPDIKLQNVPKSLNQVLFEMMNENEEKIQAQILFIHSQERQQKMNDARILLRNSDVSFKELPADLYDYEKSRIFHEYKILQFLMHYFQNTFAREMWLKTKIRKVKFSKEEYQDKITQFLESKSSITKYNYYNRQEKETELEWTYICEYFLNNFGFYQPNAQNLKFEQPEPHQLFTIEYDKEQVLKTYRQKFELGPYLQLDVFGMYDEIWSIQEITSLAQMDRYDRADALNKMYFEEQDESEKPRLLQKIQRLYIIINNYYYDKLSIPKVNNGTFMLYDIIMDKIIHHHNDDFKRIQQIQQIQQIQFL